MGDLVRRVLHGRLQGRHNNDDGTNNFGSAPIRRQQTRVTTLLRVRARIKYVLKSQPCMVEMHRRFLCMHSRKQNQLIEFALSRRSNL